MYENKLKILIFCLLLLKASTYSTKADDNADNGELMYDSNYNDISDNNDVNLEKRTPSIYVIKRPCVRRGGNCDYRPHDCCHSSPCRCNLWGTNCRCTRMGLFQKWG